MRRALSLFCLLFVAFPAISSPPAEARPTFERAVFLRINQARKAHRLAPLRPAPRLRAVAVRHAGFLARLGLLQHSSADGSSFDLRIRRHLPAHVVGETVARGPSPLWVVRAWLRSPQHRALLLDPAFGIVGVGARPGAVGTVAVMYVTADFARL